MKAVILAAGQSTRTHPLTITKPKPLLKIANRALIEHNLEQLNGLVDEVIIVIGYKGETIKKTIGNKFEDIRLLYVNQDKPLGTGHALKQAEKLLGKGRFICMMGDDLYFRGDIRKCLKYPLSVLAKRVEDFGNFGIFTKKGDKLMDLVEKPENYVSDLANSGFYVFDDKIFQCLSIVKKSERGEYELTDALRHLAIDENIFCVEAQVWFPIAYPWDLLEADQVIRYEHIISGKNTSIKGDVVDSSIGNNCVIEGNIKNSIIGDNVRVLPGAIVEDSVIGDNVIFGGVIKGGDKVEMIVNKKMIVVENFGAAIGDGCNLHSVQVAAGTLVWPKVKKKGANLKGIVKK